MKLKNRGAGQDKNDTFTKKYQFPKKMFKASYKYIFFSENIGEIYEFLRNVIFLKKYLLSESCICLGGEGQAPAEAEGEARGHDQRAGGQDEEGQHRQAGDRAQQKEDGDRAQRRQGTGTRTSLSQLFQYLLFFK